MSIFVKGNTALEAFTNLIPLQIYLSTSYSLTGSDLYIQYKTPPISVHTNVPYAVKYITNFGDTPYSYYSNPNQQVHYNYKTAGTYYVSYSAVFSDKSLRVYTVPTPFIIKNQWSVYDEQQLRLVNELTLNLPYTLNQIEIQPNEFGVEDIFNTSVSRIQECVDYLVSNTQTINTDSPTIYFGWFGNNAQSKAVGIRWFTQSFNSEYVNDSDTATTDGGSYFSNLIDCVETDNLIYALDGTSIRAFYSDAEPVEIKFTNASDIKDLLSEPTSFDIDETGKVMFVVDPPANKIYKFLIDLTQTTPAIDLQLYTGGYGGFFDHDRFNSPTEISYLNGYVYVLDYNNNCIKQFNSDLNWIHTYISSSLDNDQPISVAVHPQTSYVYVLSESHTVYVFENLGLEPFVSFKIPQTKDGYPLLKIIFDENGDFFYILTNQNVFKYSASNTYVAKLKIPKTQDVTYRSIKKAPNRSLNISSPLCMLKCQDVLEIFRLGEGLPYNYWDKNQIKVYADEFSSDINYNRSLVRMAQNIKTFRDTLNAKFVLAKEQTIAGLVTYLSWIPINSQNLPKLNLDVESETLGVGVNELHVPQVFNKELKKLYDSVVSIKNYLNIDDYSINHRENNLDCPNVFCWSWKAMSCYNLTLPVIRTCDINPLTYMELRSDFPSQYNYAGSKDWQSAHSDCCRETSSKLISTITLSDSEYNYVINYVPPTPTPIPPTPTPTVFGGFPTPTPTPIPPTPTPTPAPVIQNYEFTNTSFLA